MEKFKQLENPRTFMLEDRLRASNFLRNTNCQKCKDAKRFGRPEIMDSGFLLEKHSPLKEVLKHGMVDMRESGALERIEHGLEGNYIPQPQKSSLPLTIQLLAMLFIFLGVVAMVICPTVLAIEHLLKWLSTKLMANSVNPQFKNCERIYEERKCKHCGLKKIRQEICVK